MVSRGWQSRLLRPPLPTATIWLTNGRVAPTSSKDTFDLGLALAGAISAGAYTAGVLDFLFQALNEWEKVRTDPATPGHRVELQVVAGASAGAITGALGVVALAHGMQPREFTREEKEKSYRAADRSYQEFRCVLPSLYDTWVTRPRLVDPNSGLDFLSSQDLNGPIVSVLNAKLLDEIKHQALLSSGEPSQTHPPYAYIATYLHVYMTVSNLRGIPFTVQFGNSTYGMQTHGDRAHFTIGDLGSGASAQNGWIDTDSSESLSVVDLLAAGPSVPQQWDRYGTYALASSAFPIGLAPRHLAAPMEGYLRRSYPITGGAYAISPNFPRDETTEFAALNVDGGLINNNPFDYAQFAVMGDASADKTDGAEADRAVIMVAPFPEPPAFLPKGQPVDELVPVIRALFPALMNQARFKVGEIVPALDPDDHSRFLIAPHRKLDGREERYTIACGLLDGFGGFLDEKFRAHDFQLGRRNCQAFLRSTFAVPGSNPIVADMTGREQFRIAPNQAAGKPENYPIIPLLGAAQPEVPLPYWPRMSQADFELLLDRIKIRLTKIAPLLIQSQTTSPLLRWIGYLGLFFARGRVLEYARFAILSDLVRRDQIEDWELPPNLAVNDADDVRAVLAELASPSFTYRTSGGIATKAHLQVGFVDGVLQQLSQADENKPFRVWQGRRDEKQVFTLASRRPSWFWSLPVLRRIGDWLEAPAIG